MRMRDYDADRGGGPGLFFILVALVAVAILGARYLGFYPSGSFDTQGPGKSTPAAGSSGQAGPLVAIYHSHTTESYAPGDSHARGEPGEIVEVGKTLKEALELRGVVAIHDQAVYDYPVFADAYQNARQTIIQTVQSNPSLQMVFDVHRDGLPPEAPASTCTTQINGEKVARILLVVGDTGNPHQDQNLAFAQALDARMNEMYPGLSRGVKVRAGDFNDSVFPKAVGVFIGSYPQNTLEEAQRAAKLFADVAATMIDEGKEEGKGR